MCVCVCVCVWKSLSHVQLFATPRTVACQASLFMEFSRQSTGVHCHSLLQGSRPRDQTLVSCIAGRFFTIWPTGKSCILYIVIVIMKSLSRVRFFATPWTVANQGPPSMDCPGRNTGVGCHFLLQGIFPSQGLNPGLPHCRQILYHLSHQGRPNFIYSSMLISTS